MIKWAVVELYIEDGDLEFELLNGDFDNILDAEDRRLYWLNQDTSINPQMIQVIQYAD